MEVVFLQCAVHYRRYYHTGANRVNAGVIAATSGATRVALHQPVHQVDVHWAVSVAGKDKKGLQIQVVYHHLLRTDSSDANANGGVSGLRSTHTDAYRAEELSTELMPFTEIPKSDEGATGGIWTLPVPTRVVLTLISKGRTHVQCLMSSPDTTSWCGVVSQIYAVHYYLNFRQNTLFKTYFLCLKFGFGTLSITVSGGRWLRRSKLGCIWGVDLRVLTKPKAVLVILRATDCGWWTHVLLASLNLLWQLSVAKKKNTCHTNKCSCLSPTHHLQWGDSVVTTY